jgi:hypothetical protein
MRKLVGLGVLAVTAFTFGGCAFTTATPSVQGRAYVVRSNVGGSDFWNCDATSGEPVCYQTKKKYAPPVAK